MTLGEIETAELSIQGMPTSLYTTVLQNLILGYWFHEIPVGVLWQCSIKFENINLNKFCYCRISQDFKGAL